MPGQSMYPDLSVSQAKGDSLIHEAMLKPCTYHMRTIRRKISPRRSIEIGNTILIRSSVDKFLQRIGLVIIII